MLTFSTPHQITHTPCPEKEEIFLYYSASSAIPLSPRHRALRAALACAQARGKRAARSLGSHARTTPGSTGSLNSSQPSSTRISRAATRAMRPTRRAAVQAALRSPLCALPEEEPAAAESERETHRKRKRKAAADEEVVSQ